VACSVRYNKKPGAKFAVYDCLDLIVIIIIFMTVERTDVIIIIIMTSVLSTVVNRVLLTQANTFLFA